MRPGAAIARRIQEGTVLEPKEAESIIEIAEGTASSSVVETAPSMWEFLKIRSTSFWGPYNKGPTI